MSKLNWEALRDEAAKEMADIWPTVCKLRNELRELEDLYNYWEAERTEAERRLVEAIKVKPAKRENHDR